MSTRKKTVEKSEVDFLSMTKEEKVRYLLTNWAEASSKFDDPTTNPSIKLLQPFTMNLVALNELVTAITNGTVLNADIYAKVAIVCARLAENLLTEKLTKEASEKEVKEEVAQPEQID